MAVVCMDYQKNPEHIKELNREYNKAERVAREQRKIEKQQFREQWFINSSKIRYCLRISRATFFNWVNKRYLILEKCKFGKLITSYSYKSFYEFLETNSYVYIKGKKEKISYKPLPNKLPTYYKIEECAEMLGKNRRSFKDMIDRTPEKLEGIIVLKIGNPQSGYTIRIETKSFLKYVKTWGR